jgi:hypothetical protein
MVGLSVSGGLNNRGFLFWSESAGTSGAMLVLEDGEQSLLFKATAPEQNGGQARAKLSRQLVIGNSPGRA